MGNVERPGSDGGSDWRARLATGLGTVAGATVALLLRTDLGSFWLGLLAFLLVTGVGGVLGRLAGFLLFQRPPGR